MSLKHLLQNRLIEQFNKAKLEGAGPLSPRDGYYFIKDVNYRDIPDKGKHPIAITFWKPNREDSFLKDVYFEISLSALRLENPYDYINLNKKMILIDEATIVLTNSLANPLRIECKFQVLNRKPNFITAQSLVLSSFMGTATILSEAYSNYESNLGINLADAIESEASLDDGYDDQTDDDTYDSPIED